MTFVKPLELTAAQEAATPEMPMRAPLREREPSARYRVAMVGACPMPARRGTPLRVERLAEALTARGHHVEVITYHIADEPHPLQFPVHRIFRRPLYWRMPAGPNLRKLFLYDPALMTKLWQVVAAGHFDVIHAHHIEGLLVAIPTRIRRRIPLVYDAHTMLSSELPSYGWRAARQVVGRTGEWLDGLLPRGADHVAAVTPDIRDRLVERHGLSPDQISVVTNGVEMESFRVDAAGARNGVVQIIYTGTLAPYQDVELLLEAFARAHRIRGDLRLCFSVSSPFEPYEAQARELGIRHAIEVLPDGFSELPRRLADSDIAVLPRTRCDGIPQKLLNYMAAGKAIVSSAGSAKVIEHERTGLVVANDDTEGFAHSLLRLAADPRLAHELGQSARSEVEQNFSWGQAAERLEQVYSRVTVLR